MLDLLEGLFGLIGEILKLFWFPMIVVMLISVFATPVLRHLPIRDELRQPLQRIFRIAAYASTALVLLAFVFLFGSLWLVGQHNPSPPA